MADVPTIASLVSSCKDVDFLQLFAFSVVGAHLKKDIIHAMASDAPTDSPPPQLASIFSSFLAKACRMDVDEVHVVWDALKEYVWTFDRDPIVSPVLSATGLEGVFKSMGHTGGLSSSRNIYPAVQTCTNTTCKYLSNGRKLQEAVSRQVIIYTRAMGPLYAWATHLSCGGCQRVYHCEYYVEDGVCNYYSTPAPPPLLEVGEHQYVEQELAQEWRLDSNMAWVSASNAASIYNRIHGAASTPPEGFTFGSHLRTEQTWDSFVLSSLIEHHARSGTVLRVPHGGAQKDRFTTAMRERNDTIRLYGHREAGHECTKCVRLYPKGTVVRSEKTGEESTLDEVRMVSAVVIDGVTVGRPCCRVPNCKESLASNRDRFCPSHLAIGHDRLCVVVKCTRVAREGKRTCNHPDHQHVEEVHELRGHAAFQLRERIQRANVAHPNSSQPVDSADAVEALYDEDDAEFILPSSQQEDESEPVRVRAHFGRARTHNEQLMVRTCGIITMRETFYHAEAVSSVVEMIKRCYAHRPWPNHIIFDNNCSLSKHIKDDPAFKDVGLTVDVFHFKCKHSKKDEFCQQNCNPYLFPELRSEDGKGWYFNTSIAEQTNVWMGGYHSICREMGAVKYDFFLDEMVMMRNEYTKARLEKSGVILA